MLLSLVTLQVGSGRSGEFVDSYPRQTWQIFTQVACEIFFSLESKNAMKVVIEKQSNPSIYDFNYSTKYSYVESAQNDN